MNGNLDDICRKTKRVGNKQLMLFTQIVRQHLLNAGIDRKQLETVLKKAVKEFRANQTYDTDCIKALNDLAKDGTGKEHRGIDSIGRILVEYCFFRVPETKIIWPENSEQDTESRIGFVDGVLPRPLMRYFLVSVRGTIPQLNKFEASSVLFGKENTDHENRKAYVDDLIKEFVKPAPNNTEINWNHIYNDARFKKIALELIGDIRRKIEQFGLERYLRILENLRQRDPEKDTLNAMQRPFTIEDVKLIDESLWAAEGYLAQNI